MPEHSRAVARPVRFVLSTSGRPRVVLLSASLGFVLWQLLLSATVEFGWPALRDPEVVQKSAQLRQRVAERPEDPLLLFLGSSRTFNGIAAGRLAGVEDSEGRLWHAYNFGITAAGPIRQRLVLEAILAQGIRPARLVVEVLPALLNEPGDDRLCEENWIHVPGLTVGEMWRAGNFVSNPSRFRYAWLRSRLWPCIPFGPRLCTRMEGFNRNPECALPAVERMDSTGWTANPGSTDPAEKTLRVRAALEEYHRAFRDFRIGEGPVRAVREVLGMCLERRIAVTLVLMPEATAFRTGEAIPMQNAVECLSLQLSREFGCSYVDAREWLTDEEFADGHHLLPSGATRFTDRLAGVLFAPASGANSMAPVR